MASIGACAAFGAVTGSSAAALVTIGTSAIPQMRRYGYSTKLATGCIAAAGFLAFAIPPSNILVLYGIICEQSIGKLFMASMVPGIITAAIFITGTWLMAKFIPTMAPVTPVKFTLKERVTASLGLWEVVILFLIVMGGLYTGVYTASEAGAIGGFAALIMLLAHRRTRSLRFIYQGMKDASSTTCMILIVIMSAAFMNLYMVLGGVAKAIETSMTSLPFGPTGVIIIIVLMYILMGMFLDTIAMVLLTAPILLPVVVNLGYDPIWFGVFVTQMVEVALITPPMAMNIFIVRGMVPDVPFTDIAIGIVPYLIMELIVVALLIAFPQIALWLPSLMMS
jgi:tripartite ATP-independent transporter DctM subunit